MVPVSPCPVLAAGSRWEERAPAWCPPPTPGSARSASPGRSVGQPWASVGQPWALALTGFVNQAGFATPPARPPRRAPGHLHPREHGGGPLRRRGVPRRPGQLRAAAEGAAALAPKVSPDAPMRSLVMTAGRFECYAAPAASPPRHVSCPRLATPDVARAAAGDCVQIEVLGPPPPHRGTRRGHSGPRGSRAVAHDDLAAYSVTVAGANTPNRSTGCTPTRPRRHSGSEQFSPVNTIDPPRKGNQPTRRLSPSPPIRPAR